MEGGKVQNRSAAPPSWRSATATLYNVRSSPLTFDPTGAADTMKPFQSVVLAAGKGTRLNSEKAKVLHEVLGRPMVSWAVRGALEAGADRAVVVTGYNRENVERWLTDHEDPSRLAFAVHDNQLGTGHDVWMAEE